MLLTFAGAIRQDESRFEVALTCLSEAQFQSMDGSSASELLCTWSVSSRWRLPIVGGRARNWLFEQEK